MMITALLLSALVTDPASMPAEPAAPPPVVATLPATPAAIPEEDIRLFAAIAGRKVVGRPVGGPYPTADKILLLVRDSRGNPDIGASLAIPVRQSLPAPPDGTLAVVRLHQRTETVVPGPTADDFAFVAANGLPLFVIGEWARPAPMWEIVWLDDAVRYRTVGEVGEIGPWRD